MDDLQKNDQNSDPSDDQLKIAAWIVALACALALPTGASQLAPGIVADPGKLNKDAATAMIQVFTLTGPLVLGTAFITLCALRSWFSGLGIWILFGVCVAILIIGALGFGLAPDTNADSWNLGHPALTLAGYVLTGYAHVTGWPLTLVSLALGWLVGFAANAKMPPEWKKSLDDAFVNV